MKTIILLGELGKRYGRKHLLDVKSPAEAVRALCANFKDFAEFVSSSQERNVGYRVLNRRHDVALEDLHNPASQQIVLVPVVAGAGGKGGLFQTILGAALIVAAFVLPPGPWTQPLFSIGISLAIGGVAQMLSPLPKSPGQDESAGPSYIFNGSVNTQAQGYPVPVGYGRMIVGSAVISAGISVEDIQA